MYTTKHPARSFYCQCVARRGYKINRVLVPDSMVASKVRGGSATFFARVATVTCKLWNSDRTERLPYLSDIILQLPVVFLLGEKEQEG